jgi:hypothetical protein
MTDSMSPDELIGSFLFGTFRLVFDEHGLAVDQCDPADVHTIGTSALLAYRLAAKSENISDGFLARFCVQTGVLLAAERGAAGAKAAAEWFRARDEYIATRDDWDCYD